MREIDHCASSERKRSRSVLGGDRSASCASWLIDFETVISFIGIHVGAADVWNEAATVCLLCFR